MASGVSAQVPQAQLEHMGRRLRSVPPRSARRRIRLKFLEHKVNWTNLTNTLSGEEIGTLEPQR